MSENNDDLLKKNSTKSSVAVKKTKHTANDTVNDSNDANFDNVSSMKTSNQQDPVEKKAAKQKSGSKCCVGLFVVMLLLVSGLGYAGYYWHNLQLQQISEKINAINIAAQPAQNEQLNAQLAEKYQQNFNQLNNYVQDLQKSVKNVASQNSIHEQQILSLQKQINQLSLTKSELPHQWLVAEAGFLLQTAQNKIDLDADFVTAENLLQDAEQILARVADPSIFIARTAISQDLATIQQLNVVDKTQLVSILAALLAQVEQLELVSMNSLDKTDVAISDSVSDWEDNVKTSIVSFGKNFIKVNKKSEVGTQIFTPEQATYLRENIRLQLQLAIIAVYKHQDGVYHQVLTDVQHWLQKHLDLSAANAAQFNKNIMELNGVTIIQPIELKSLPLIQKILAEHKHSTPSDAPVVESESDATNNEANYTPENN